MANQIEEDADALFNTLELHDCQTVMDIAAVNNWPEWRATSALAYVRRPDNARALRWTVPHVSRGPAGLYGQNQRHFRVVLLDEEQEFTDEEIVEILRGGVQTLSHVATMSENESFALQAFMGQIAGCSPPLRRSVRNLRSAMEDVVHYSREAADLAREELVSA